MKNLVAALSAAMLAIASAAPCVLAQTPSAPDPCQNPTYRQCPQALPERTFYLKNNYSSQFRGGNANEIITAMRNMLSPEAKLYLVPSEDAIVARAMPDDIALMQKILNDLDRPQKTYRLTYTITEMDGARRLGSQRFAMILTDGQKTSLDQTSKVPIATSSNPGGVQTQFSYVDVGINFEATLYATGNGAKLDSKVTQSSVADENSPESSQSHPVQRHITLEGSSMLTSGKPVMLGSIDVPGSTRHLDIEAVMEPLP